MYCITRKYCSECGKEISESKKEIAALHDIYKIERELCIYCIHAKDWQKK